jgi:hypothetical protein
MDPLARLEAIAAIGALKARYFRTLDTKDWAGYEAVFTPDLIADFRDASGARDETQLTNGASEYVGNLAALLDGVVTVHHGHMAEIQFESVGEAQGIWAMEDKLWPGEGSVLPFRWLHGYGHYHERYRRDDDQWRIAEIRLTRLRIDAG